MMESQTLDLFAGAIPASHLALPGSDKARQMTALSGKSISDLSKRSGQLGLLQKMLLDTSQWGSTTCWLTWKVKTTPSRRLLFQLVPSVPGTEGTGLGLLPTPTATADAKGSPKGRFNGSGTEKSNLREVLRDGPDDPIYPHPLFVERMMGYPEKWTDLNN